MWSNEGISMSDLKDAIASARADALREAKDSAPHIRSRGTWLCTADKHGQCRPCPEAEAQTWSGTKREIEQLIARVIAEHPHVTEVYIAGGYDGYDTFKDMMDCGEYYPWVSSWSVTVWERQQ